jgi:HK97 gp10 family phage protein
MIRPEGAAAVSERLTELAEAIRRNLTAAIKSEAESLQAEAKRRCPVDTGALRDSIRADVFARDADVEAAVGSGLDYAPAVELGTLARPPKPYLAPALRARRAALIERCKRAVRYALGGNTE